VAVQLVIVARRCQQIHPALVESMLHFCIDHCRKLISTSPHIAVLIFLPLVEDPTVASRTYAPLAESSGLMTSGASAIHQGAESRWPASTTCPRTGRQPSGYMLAAPPSAGAAGRSGRTGIRAGPPAATTGGCRPAAEARRR
jgi:hypothetical protein